MSESPVAVRVQGLTKKFRLYDDKYTLLKDRFIHIGRIRHQLRHQEITALDNVSFDIPAGQSFGVVGRNGSGKSTLLKCIAGILQPTKGSVSVRGKLAAMLELGTGFEPNLSGRDNIFINGALLGVPKREIQRRFDEIVEFSELGSFIDGQVKFYSSGMYMRLGFSIAVTLEPDVLVVDEVLAVGDERFQAKCLERMKSLRAKGTTIILVSHDLDSVRRFCDRAIGLEHGVILADGAPSEAILAIREEMLHAAEEPEHPAANEQTEDQAAPQDQGTLRYIPKGTRLERAVRLTGAEVIYPASPNRPYLLPHDPLEVRVSYEVDRPAGDVVFGLAIVDQQGFRLFATDTEILGTETDLPLGPGEVVFRCPDVPLQDGIYELVLGIRSLDGGTMHDWREGQDRISVSSPGIVHGEVAFPFTAEVYPGSQELIQSKGVS